MLSILGPRGRLCEGVTRREVLQAGGLSLLGVTLPQLLAAAPQDKRLTADPTFGRAKNVIFLYLAGGPPQHETFDPKPNAPAEIRGAFQPISTNVPGIQFCELLPRTAAMADKLAVVRSMATDDNIHSSSSHWVLTGYKYQGPNARTINPTDWPYFGSIVKRYKPSDKLPSLSTVWIPDIMRLNENVTPAGQTGGLMGSQWDPERFVGDPSLPEYTIEGLRLRDGMSPLRLRSRQTLLDQFKSSFRQAGENGSLQLFNTYQQQAFDLMSSGKAQHAFAIQQEPDKVRQRYGRNRWGQCVLLARRLIESGVRLVHVQWPREDGDNAVDNPLWDTHAQNFDRVEDVLCPIFDVGFTALIEDLEQRGLLDETLVVAIGEFGRTPKINANAGRDHWGSVFSFAMAGAGISGGQVYGSSDSQGAYPKTDRVEPGNLTATIFHLLGLDYRTTFHDLQGRELSLTKGEPLYRLLGSQPATSERTRATGDVTRVPAYDPKRLLKDTDFAASKTILPATASSRPKGWRQLSSLAKKPTPGVGIWLPDRRNGRPLEEPTQAAIGFDLSREQNALQVTKGAEAILAQEVRSPFAGNYLLTAELVGDASSQEVFKSVFDEHFSCQLAFIQFTNRSKQIHHRKILASLTFQPRLWKPRAKLFDKVTLSKAFLNPNPGGNFSFGLGLGVALMVSKTTQQPLNLKPGDRAMLRIARLELVFAGKEINKEVEV